MKKFLKGFCQVLLILLTFGCLNPEDDNSGQCVEGTIPFVYYRLIFPDCYRKTFWIEVFGAEKIGKSVTIPKIQRGEHPEPAVKYFNVIEAIIPDYNFNETLLESLQGSSIYFEYRYASKEEISDVRNDSPCKEIYDYFELPVIVITRFSFESCPKHSENQ
ncbi:hypothetical protein [Mongoliitalea daihaiensis]|uniref:hypothetical protein n=1 Tax=Mongoliitalea daihaiensis TaxID=2782006 RepID=UPI001F24AB7E|nr:hypothetical protein [Mongoliitalea daihaiensis]UJP63632.1 hypothetical protein IPZ59_12380 [Mongoliitalea daihaiensis]